MKLRLSLTIAILAALPAAAWADTVGVIVSFHGDVDDTLFAQHGGWATVRLPHSNAIAGRVPSERLKALRLTPGVASVEEDVILHASLTPNDPKYAASQKATFDLIHAPAAWDISKGDGVRVCVLDTGVLAGHEDLGSGGSGKVKIGKNFTSADDADWVDRHGHGTHTSGTAGAQSNNSVGVTSAGFNCELAMGKVLDDTGSGSTSWIAAGIDWAVASSGSKVISMSFGGGGTTALRDSVNAAWNSGLLLVAAAGNSNSTTVEYPGGYSNVMSVASTDSSGHRSSFSTYGPTVDIAAPGSNITSTYKDSTSSYAVLSGTSMATPHVAGIAALVWAHTPGATNGLVRLRLESSPTVTVLMPDGGLVPLLDAEAALKSTASLPEVTVTASDPGASENGSEIGVFTLHRNGSTSSDLAVSFTVGGTATSGADYSSIGTSVTIPAGSDNATVTVTPVDDGIYEGDETVVLTVVSGLSYNAGSPKAATVTIHDNDSPPTVTVSASTPEASEAGPVSGVFTFSRTGSTAGPVTVKFSVAGSAKKDVDYASIGTSVTILAGSATATKTVVPIDDPTHEKKETVVVTISSDALYVVGNPKTATVTIADNDVKASSGGNNGGCGLLGLEALALLAILRRRDRR